MIDATMLDELARPGNKTYVGDRRPPLLGEVFSRVVSDGWAPRNPAYGAELDSLEVSVIRGNCINPLLVEGDEVFIDPNMPPQRGDVVSFALSARAVEAQNSSLPPGQSPWMPGARWCKLFATVYGIDFLFERFGHSITTTFAACESPDATPVLHPVRNVRRGGRLLFAPPDTHASNLGTNAATSIVTATYAGPTTYAASTGTYTPVSATFTPITNGVAQATMTFDASSSPGSQNVVQLRGVGATQSGLTFQSTTNRFTLIANVATTAGVAVTATCYVDTTAGVAVTLANVSIRLEDIRR